MENGRCRVMLEKLWRRKVDEIVGLSMAYHDDHVPSDPVAALTSRHARGDTLLMGRVMRAHEDLALIEDAIDRIKDGSYGICSSCARSIGADLLTEMPYARDCPDGCLSQVSWQPAEPPYAAGSPAIAS